MVPFLPTCTFEESLLQARRDAEAWSVASAANGPAKSLELSRNKLDAMVRSPRLTILLLDHPDVELRVAALTLVLGYWPSREAFAAPCLKLAFEDADSAVRGGALKSLIRLRWFISDPSGFLEKLLRAIFGSISDDQRTRAIRVVDDARTFMRQSTREMIEKIAGVHVDEMLESRTAAESFLQSPDPEARYAALFVLAHNWEFTRELADLCERILFDDPDAKVRLRALASLGTFYSRSDEPRIGQILATIVRDSAETLELRTHAYRMLFMVRGMPSEIKETAYSPTFRFPDDVDWGFVNSFALEGGTDGMN